MQKILKISDLVLPKVRVCKNFFEYFIKKIFVYFIKTISHQYKKKKKKKKNYLNLINQPYIYKQIFIH